MRKDLKYALRMLMQSKGWTAVVLLSLALGIGANTALFSAVSGLLLQKLPVPEPESLVRLLWYGDNDMMRNSSEYGSVQPYQGKDVRSTFSYAVYQEMRKANSTLSDLFTCAPIGSVNLVLDNEADLATTFGVSGNYFQLLRVGPAHGRLLTEADDQPGAPAVAVISHALWRKRFASNPDVPGRVVTMNNQPVTIVGVTPESFIGVQRLGVAAHEVMVPIALDSLLNPSQTRLKEPTTWFLHIMGRLKLGATIERVQANLNGVLQSTAAAGMADYMASLTAEQRNLSTNRREGSAVPTLLAEPGPRGVYDVDLTTSRSVGILSAVVIVILLIVSANVANLLLSRATSRQKEISVRLSMGATRGRLIRQLLTESVVLSLIGGLLGMVVGYWSRQLLPFGQTTPIDWRVFAFAAGVSVLTGLIFGLAPAFRATRVELAGAMKENSRSVSRTRSLLSKSLIVVQVALSLVLIIGAGLFLRTLSNLRRVDVGFDTRNLVIFSVNPTLNRYSPDRVTQTYQQMQEALRAVPGVRSVALTRVALLSGSRSSSSRYVQGEAKEHNLHVMTVSPEFFETLSIPVLLGRAFTANDRKESPKVAVINESAAKLLFGNESPIGRRMGSSPETSGDFEVIGVLRDTKYSDLRIAPPPTWYDLYAQGAPRPMQFVVRTASDPAGLVEAIRGAVKRVDSTLPITNLSTQAERVEQRFAQERLFANAYSLFGGLALVLACIGLFGVMSYNVARRTNEIGIRMALGAGRLHVARMVLTECWLLIGIGVAIGVGAALAAGRLVAQVLFGLQPTDVVTLGSAMALIVVVSTLAGYVPARRASRVDPIVALHRE